MLHQEWTSTRAGETLISCREAPSMPWLQGEADFKKASKLNWFLSLRFLVKKSNLFEVMILRESLAGQRMDLRDWSGARMGLALLWKLWDVGLYHPTDPKFVQSLLTFAHFLPLHVMFRHLFQIFCPGWSKERRLLRRRKAWQNHIPLWLQKWLRTGTAKVVKEQYFDCVNDVLGKQTA